MNKILQNVTFIVFLLFGLQAISQETIWLSNSPPDAMKKEVKASGMHRYSSLISKKRGGKTKGDSKTKKSKYQKNATDSTSKKDQKSEKKKGESSYKRPSTKYAHWLREGSSIKDSKYVSLADSTDYQLIMMSPEGKSESIELVKDKASYAKFELNEEGYHNAYLIIKKGLGDTLHINISKAELLSHSCRNGHHKKLEARPVRYYPEISEFEVIRQRHPYEDYHFFTSSGDTETFKTILDGEALEGVKVTINTEKGWSRTLMTDKNGEINTEFIQDYFSNWKELNTRKIYYYMLQADYTLKKDIHYNGKDYKYIHYTVTMSDGYRPSKTMYTSMFWGLIIFLITTLVSVIGVFIYKERRKRPYKEVRFNESNK